jgi:hypothetical protein
MRREPVPGLDVLNTPAKRNIKALTAEITGLSAGDLATATFSVPRYGAFNIEGSVQFSATTGSIMLAGRAIDASLKPEKALQTLAASGPGMVDAGGPDVTADGDSAAAQLTASVRALEHGAVVRATFVEPAYGPFSVTGICVAAPVGDAFMVGSWFIARHGVPAARLARLEILASPDEHSLPVPAQITSWGDDAAAVSTDA